MDAFYQKILDLAAIPTLSKHEQIIQAFTSIIEEEEISVGDKLPSINEMVNEVGFARKTIVKAYNELKERGLVESKKLKGYFVISNDTKVTLKVALVLYAFHSFQEDFYNTFRKELGTRYHIDVFFHHNNNSLFESILNNISDKFGMYVIAPIQNPEAQKLLLNIPANKLLLIDRYLKMPVEYSFIVQEFEEITYNKLVELKDSIKQYDKFILVFKEHTDFPLGILNAFERFIKDFSVNGSIIRAYEPDSLMKNTAYFFISDNQLWRVLKDVHKYDYTLGKDIGVLAHDDNIVKEIAFGGITTISTDFNSMAISAAVYVKETEVIHKTISTSLKLRNSL